MQERTDVFTVEADPCVCPQTHASCITARAITGALHEHRCTDRTRRNPGRHTGLPLHT